MRKLVITAVAALFSAIAVPAEQLLQCVNPDILDGIVFLGNSQDKMEITRGLPAAMSNFHAPEGMSLIGTGVFDRGGRNTIVAFKTALPTGKAHSEMVAAFGADGWALEDSQGSRSTFNVAGAPKYGTLCRNGERRLLSVTDLSDTRYVNVSMYSEPEMRSCNAPQVTSRGIASEQQRGALPRFQFPAGTSIARGGGGGGGGSTSGGSVQVVISSTRAISTETPAKMVEILEQQLTAQGWRVVSDWVGGSSGSTWRKTIDGKLAWGTLEVVGVSQGTLDVDFTMAVSPL